MMKWQPDLLKKNITKKLGEIIGYTSDPQNNNKASPLPLSTSRLAENCSSNGGDTAALREQIPFPFYPTAIFDLNAAPDSQLEAGMGGQMGSGRGRGGAADLFSMHYFTGRH